MRDAFDGIEQHVIEILFELYVADENGRRLAVSDVSRSAGLAPTTGLRWLFILEQKSIIKREKDPRDRRRSFIVLTTASKVKLQDVIRNWSLLVEPGGRLPLLGKVHIIEAKRAR